MLGNVAGVDGIAVGHAAGSTAAKATETDPAAARRSSIRAICRRQARLVHRGGSYKSQPGELRCSARGNATPDSKIPWRGFRVAMEV